MNAKVKRLQPLDNFCKETLLSAMKSGYRELLDFACKPEFQALLDELYSLAPHERIAFVNSVVLEPKQMAERGLEPPLGILIQRSSFGDRRPTLFCIKKYIDERLQTHWQNVNITFDNLYEDADIPRDHAAWRRPLPFELQQALVAKHIEESDLSDIDL